MDLTREQAREGVRESERLIFMARLAIAKQPEGDRFHHGEASLPRMDRRLQRFVWRGAARTGGSTGITALQAVSNHARLAHDT
jgi:hypothetical protein